METERVKIDGNDYDFVMKLPIDEYDEVNLDLEDTIDLTEDLKDLDNTIVIDEVINE